MDLFLTSPFGSKDLNLHLSATMSVPSIQPSMKAHPTMDADGTKIPSRFEQKIDVSSAVGYVPRQTENENVAIEKSVRIPQELLERISLSSGSEFTSTQSSFDGDEGDGPLESQVSFAGEGGQHTARIPPISSPLLANGSATGEESKSLTVDHLLTMEDTSPLKIDSQTHSVDLQQSPVGGNHSNSGVQDHNHDDLSLNGQHFYPSGDNMADETLIGDQVEPSVMQEADEFSQFDPTHLMSLLNQDSLLANSRSPATKSSGLESPLHDAPHLADSESKNKHMVYKSEIPTTEELNDSHTSVDGAKRVGDISLMSSSTASDEYASAVSDTPNPQSASPPVLEVKFSHCVLSH